MTSRRIPTTRIVVRASHSLERRGLVDRHRASPILVLLARILDGSALSGEVVSSSSRRGRVGDGRVQHVGWGGRHRGRQQVRASETPCKNGVPGQPLHVTSQWLPDLISRHRISLTTNAMSDISGETENTERSGARSDLSATKFFDWAPQVRLNTEICSGDLPEPLKRLIEDSNVVPDWIYNKVRHVLSSVNHARDHLLITGIAEVRILQSGTPGAYTVPCLWGRE